MSKQVESAPVAVVEGADVAVVRKTDQLPVVDRGPVAQLVGDAQRQGLPLDGEGGLLAELTRLVVESALEREITDHLGYDKLSVAARPTGTPSTHSTSDSMAAPGA